MEQPLYRIGEASTQLGLHDKNSNTLRSWVEEFKDFLGGSANPEPGRPRFFTEDDLRVLGTVRDLRLNHLPYSEIRSRLAQGTHAVERPSAKFSEELEVRAPRDGEMVAGDQFQTLLAPMARAADEWRALAEQYRSRMEDREARVATLEGRIDTLQTRLAELYSTAVPRAAVATPPAAAPSPPPVARVRRRRWFFGI